MSSLFQLGAKPPPDFSDPIGFLTACHRRLEGHLATLARVTAALRADGPAAPLAEVRAALGGTLVWFDDAGHKHALDEDASLFPRLQSPIVHELAAEHRMHEAIYLALRRVAERLAIGDTDARLVDDLTTHATALTAAYQDHIAREEQELFPLARRELDERELRAIGLEMRMRRG